MNEPLVSIGVPVFNGGSTLIECLDLLLSQTFYDFELIISDNCSTDNTQSICREYAKKDDRIKYFRQEKNIGALKNFQFVLSKSIGMYFMWAAADDLRSSDYIQENINKIESTQACIFSSSPNSLEGFEKIPDGNIVYDFEIKGSLYERISSFLDICFESHACFYSIIKREALSNFLNHEKDYLAIDWTTVIELLQQGEFHRAQGGKLVLGSNGASMQPDFFKKIRKLPVENFIPLYIFSKDLIKKIQVSPDLLPVEKLKILFKLMILNFRMLYLLFRSASSSTLKKLPY
jgi:glycosyltransferase involved in cell wall biosynthesis